MASPYGEGVYGEGAYGFGSITQIAKSFRAIAHRRRRRDLQLASDIPMGNVATLAAPAPALQLSALIPFTATAGVVASPTLQLSTLVPFTFTAGLVPDDGSLQLDAPIPIDNTATVAASATLLLDSPIPIGATASIVPSATLQLDSQIPMGNTGQIAPPEVNLTLASNVSMVDTLRVASQLKLQTATAMTNTASLRGVLALRAPVPMTNSAQLTGATPPNVVLVPSTIDHTGATDTTAQWQFMIDVYPNGTEFVVPNLGWRYRLDRTLNLVGRRDLTFTGGQFEQPPSGVLIDAVIGVAGLNLTSQFAHFPTRLQNANVSGPGIPAGTTASYSGDHGLSLSQACTPGTGLRVEVNLYDQASFLTISDGNIHPSGIGPDNLSSSATTFDASIDGAFVTGPGIPPETTVIWVNNPHVLRLSQLATDGANLTVGFHKSLRGDLTRGFWTTGQCKNITWRAGIYRGAHICGGMSDAGYVGAYEAQHAWTLASSTGCDIDGNYVEQIYGDFVYAANGAGSTVLSSGRVHNSTFLRNGRQGCSLQGVDGFEYDHNNVSEIRRSMFDFEPNNLTQFVFNVHVHDNTFGTRRLNFLSAIGGIIATPMDNIDFHDNSSVDEYILVLSGEDLLDAATTVALPPCTYANGASGVGATLTANANGTLPDIDGITVPVGGRILNKDGNGLYKGPYRVTSRGSASLPWKLTRWTGADESAELAGQTYYIESGVTQAHTGWRFNVNGPGGVPFVIGVTPTDCTQVAATGPTLPALTRSNFRFSNNTTARTVGGSAGGAIVLKHVDGVTITGNVQPMQPGRNMRMAALVQCTNYDVSGNTTVDAPAGAQFTSDTGVPGHRMVPGPLYGLTFDADAGANVAKLAPQELALNGLPHTPIVRVVCDPGEAPSRYTFAVNRFEPYSYLMLTPGTALATYTTTPSTAISAYTARFNTYLDTFEATADLIEVGNQLGRESTFDHTLGKPGGQQLVADMVTSAHNAVKARGKRSVLTLWENDWGTNNCGSGTAFEMNPAEFSALLSPTVRHAVDYLFVSWSATTCTGRPSNNIPVATIKASMQALHLLYPNAKLGFGELGLPAPVSAGTLATAQGIASYYYPLDLDLPYFTGGYFWSYAQEDAVPNSKPLFSTIKAATGPATRLDFPLGFAVGAGLPTKVVVVAPAIPAAGKLPLAIGLCASGTTTYAANVGARPNGVKYKRIDLNWWTNQGTNPTNAPAGQNDTFTFANLDAILTAAATNGYQIIGMVGYTPPWAGGNGTDGHNYPRGQAQNYPDYANFCRAVAARAEATHPGTLLAIEWWNEPNQEFLTPNSVANFAKLCQGAQDAVKTGVVQGRANRTGFPQIITIAGGTGAAPPVGSQFRHLNWTRSLVQTAPNCADHFGIHAYSGGCVLGTNNSYDPLRNDIPGIRTALNAAGRSDAQIVNTESGFFTRLDSTPTNTNDPANCNRYGSGPGDQQKQVTVTQAALLLTASYNAWLAAAAANSLALFCYYEQDNSQAGDLFNSGGLYYNPSNNYNGPAKTDAAGNPVLVNAFVALTGSTPPAVAYPELDAQKAHGADFVRLTYGWDAADPTHTGTFTANNAIRDVIAYANQIDLGVILTLGFSGSAPYQNHIYSYIPQYAAMCVGAATYFNGSPGRKLLALEIGNEPNHDKADSDTLPADKGGKYAEILIRIFDPWFGNIRSINPDLDIICGGLGGEHASGNGIDAFPFTKDVHGTHVVGGHAITVGLLTHYDGWNDHSYSYYTLPEVDLATGAEGVANLQETMDWFQSTYGRTPPIWITEFGWPTDQHFNGTTNPLYNADCADAAVALEQMARILNRSGWDVRCLAYFSFMNNNKPAGPGVGHDNYFGVVEYGTDFANAVPKPVLSAAFARISARGLTP